VASYYLCIHSLQRKLQKSRNNRIKTTIITKVKTTISITFYDKIDFAQLAAPNLVHSEVFKMLAEEEQTRLPWQLHNMTSSTGVKCVAWPPPNPKTTIATKVENMKSYPGETISYSAVESNQEIEENDSEMADAKDAFASNELVGERKIIDKPALPAGFVLNTFTLKKEVPITQKPNPIVTSEPVFRQATTLRKLGDMVWPPKSASVNNEVDCGTEPIPTKRQQKNYQEFFGEHQLNASFPMYRAPPGTQHFGLVEGENATPM